MKRKPLILYIPVIHKGYLDFLKGYKDKISKVYLIDKKLLKELSEFEPDIAYLEPEEIQSLLKSFGIGNILVLGVKNMAEVENNIILVNDEVSRNLQDKYLKGREVEWVNVFLRWDRSSILSKKPLDDIEISKDEFDKKIMEMAEKESENSSEWWRRIGAVLIKDKKVFIKANNKDLPSDHTPYQFGEPRDFFKPGERHDIASTIHAEQRIIAEAAKRGVSVAGASIYVTTFPCPVCAKIISCSGIKKVYFKEGGSNFDAKKVLESAGVKIVYVPLK